CDKEAIRAARTLSKFKPAQKGGKPVAVWLNLPIVFDIY
ncbi:MAG: energy transducer TonB, partial [Alloprevotella sp.]|nr:energy transducer TonB [Alloprevotella sp.]